MTRFSYRLFHYSPQVLIQHPLTAVVVAAGHAAVVLYFALSLLDCARGLTVAALQYSRAPRFQLLGMNRDQGRAFVFDSVDGYVVVRKLPADL